MEKITIQGIEFASFGANNYSNGMQLITCYPMPNGLIDKAKKHELQENGQFVFLNPSAPCSDEFFGVLGTKEQYQKFYKDQREAQIAKHMVEKFGYGRWPKEAAEEYRAMLEQEYKDWWE